MLLWTTFSCVKSKDYYINFENNSDKTVIVSEAFDYPSDSIGVLELFYSQPDISIKPKTSQLLFGGFEKPSSWYIHFYHSQTEYAGYVSIYVMDAGVKLRYDLETIQKDYMILARYDITQDDIERLDWKISYPPTEEMSTMHMYPPYKDVARTKE